MFELDEDMIAEIKRIAASAPPMSHEQRSNLSVLLGGIPLQPETTPIATVHEIGRESVVTVETEKAA